MQEEFISPDFSSWYPEMHSQWTSSTPLESCTIALRSLGAHTWEIMGFYTLWISAAIYSLNPGLLGRGTLVLNQRQPCSQVSSSVVLWDTLTQKRSLSLWVISITRTAFWKKCKLIFFLLWVGWGIGDSSGQFITIYTDITENTSGWFHDQKHLGNTS